MLSQTTEYALRAIVFIASEPEKAKTAQEVGEGTKVPPRYMSKVLQTLGRSGLLKSQRGLHGGFVLDRPAERITILDVVNAIEPIQRIHRCPLGLPSHIKLCPLHRRLDDAIAQVESAFRQTTIHDLLTEKTTSRPLCDAITATGPAVKVTVGKTQTK